MAPLKKKGSRSFWGKTKKHEKSNNGAACTKLNNKEIIL